MSHNGGGGPDFNLPDEVLSVIPTDPYEQLDLARKITSMAIASRVTNLEAEVSRMREKLYEKERVIYELEERVGNLQKACHESDSKLKIIVDENVSFYLFFLYTIEKENSRFWLIELMVMW